jgi:opacity protein-like surface antigen
VTQSDSKGGAWGYGFALALGVDIAVSPNVFIRGEYEYVNFPSISDIGVSFNSARVAGGLKF